MPLVSYSDGGYIQSGTILFWHLCMKIKSITAGGDYWFIVGPCPDSEAENVERRVKVGFHRQVSGLLILASEKKKTVVTSRETSWTTRSLNSLISMRKRRRSWLIPCLMSGEADYRY